jgi:hypothetical protein
MKDLGTLSYQPPHVSTMATTIFFFDLLTSRYYFRLLLLPPKGEGDLTICQLQAPDWYSGPIAGHVSGTHDNNDNIRLGFALLALN